VPGPGCHVRGETPCVWQIQRWPSLSRLTRKAGRSTRLRFRCTAHGGKASTPGISSLSVLRPLPGHPGAGMQATGTLPTLAKDAVRLLLTTPSSADTNAATGHVPAAGSASGRAGVARALAAVAGGAWESVQLYWAAWLAYSGVTLKDAPDLPEAAPGAGAGAEAGPLGLAELLAGLGEASGSTVPTASPAAHLADQWSAMVRSRRIGPIVGTTREDRAFIRLARRWLVDAVAQAPLPSEVHAISHLRGLRDRAARAMSDGEALGRETTRAMAAARFEAWCQSKRRKAASDRPASAAGASHSAPWRPVRETLKRQRWDAGSASVAQAEAAARGCAPASPGRARAFRAAHPGMRTTTDTEAATRLRAARQAVAQSRTAKARHADTTLRRVRAALADISTGRLASHERRSQVGSAVKAAAGNHGRGLLVAWSGGWPESLGDWDSLDDRVRLHNADERKGAFEVRAAAARCFADTEAALLALRLGAEASSPGAGEPVELAVPVTAARSGSVLLPRAAVSALDDFASATGLRLASGGGMTSWGSEPLEHAGMFKAPSDVHRLAADFAAACAMSLEAAQAEASAGLGHEVVFLDEPDASNGSSACEAARARTSVPDERGALVEDNVCTCDAILRLGDAVLLEAAWGKEWHTLLAVDAGAKKLLLAPSLTLSVRKAGTAILEPEFQDAEQGVLGAHPENSQSSGEGLQRKRAAALAMQVSPCSLRGMLARRGRGFILPRDNVLDEPPGASAQHTDLAAVMSFAQSMRAAWGYDGDGSSVGSEGRFFTLPHPDPDGALLDLETMAAHDRAAAAEARCRASAAQDQEAASQAQATQAALCAGVAAVVSAAAEQIASPCDLSQTASLRRALGSVAAALPGAVQSSSAIAAAGVALLRAEGRLAVAEVAGASPDEIRAVASELIVAQGPASDPETELLRGAEHIVSNSWGLKHVHAAALSAGFARLYKVLQDGILSEASVESVPVMPPRVVGAGSDSVSVAWADGATAAEYRRCLQQTRRCDASSHGRAQPRSTAWELQVKDSAEPSGWRQVFSGQQAAATVRGFGPACSVNLRARRSFVRADGSRGQWTGWAYGRGATAPESPLPPAVKCAKLLPRGMAWVAVKWEHRGPGFVGLEVADEVVAVQCRKITSSAMDSDEPTWHTVASARRAVGTAGFGWVPSATVLEVRLVASVGPGFLSTPGPTIRFVVPLPAPNAPRVGHCGSRGVEVRWSPPSWLSPRWPGTRVASERGQIFIETRDAERHSFAPGTSVAMEGHTRLAAGGAAEGDGAGGASAGSPEPTPAGPAAALKIAPIRQGVRAGSLARGDIPPQSGFDWYPVIAMPADDGPGLTMPTEGRTFWFCPLTAASVWDLGTVLEGRRGQSRARPDRVRAGPDTQRREAEAATVAHRHHRYVRVWSKSAGRGGAAFWWDCLGLVPLWELPEHVEVDAWGWPRSGVRMQDGAKDGGGSREGAEVADHPKSEVHAGAPRAVAVHDQAAAGGTAGGSGSAPTLQATQADESRAEASVLALGASARQPGPSVVSELWEVDSRGKAMLRLFSGHELGVLIEGAHVEARLALRWVHPQSGAVSQFGPVKRVSGAPFPVDTLRARRSGRHSLTADWRHPDRAGRCSFELWLAEDAACPSWRVACRTRERTAVVPGLASYARYRVEVRCASLESGATSGPAPVGRSGLLVE